MEPNKVEAMLLDDIKNGFKEFTLVFQPIIFMTGDGENLIGYETLIRWRLPPDFFVPIAEQNGLIVEVGKWVVKKLFTLINHYNNSRKPYAKFYFNVSAAQVNPEFLNYLSRLIAEHQIDTSQIGIELTETAIVPDADLLIEFVQSITLLGIDVTLDDFGIGSSGMSRLQNLAVKKIKIDKSFVKSDTKSLAILSGVSSIAKQLNVSVVVEGVETREQLEMLCDMGFCLFQGFYFGKPDNLLGAC